MEDNEKEPMIKPWSEDSDFLIYSDGRIFSKKSNKFMSSYLSNGYPTVGLNDKLYRIHNLVAKTFVENPDPINNTIPDHIDGNRENNNYSNLEWITFEENCLRYYKRGGTPNHCRAVFQFDANENLINEFKSIIDASKSTGISSDMIGHSCRGTVKFTFDADRNKYKWKYKEEKHKEDKPDGKSPSEFPNYIITKNGKIYNINSNYYLKTNINRDKYEIVSLFYNKKKKSFLVHRLVAELYLDKPESMEELQVNHLDGNRSNNKVENLQWVTPKEHSRYTFDFGKKKQMKKTVLMIDPKSNDIINSFDSVREASDKTGINYSAIANVARGVHGYKTAGGFIWKYKKNNRVIIRLVSKQ